MKIYTASIIGLAFGATFVTVSALAGLAKDRYDEFMREVHMVAASRP